MKARLPYGLILGGSLTFLVSLYFPWLNTALCVFKGGCITTHNSDVSTFGWGGFGQIAAVLALALAAGAIAAAVDRELARRLPFGWIATALGIFALLSAAELWTSGIAGVAWMKTVRIGLAPGAYFGLAGVVVACVGAALARLGAMARPRRSTVAGTLITLGLLSSFALPALNAFPDLPYGPQALAPDTCVFACLGLLAWRGRRPAPRLATAAATGVLVAAELLPLRHHYASWPYELWLLLACAAGLLVLCLIGSSGVRIRRPSASELAAVAGSAVLLVSLFLPWVSFSGGGQSFTQRGWSTTELGGVFTLGLLVALVWAGRFVRELALGAAIFVLAAGLVPAIAHDWGIDKVRHEVPPKLSLDYGAWLGFACAALLLIVCLGRFRPIPDKRFLVRLAPVLAALTLLSFEVTPNLLTLGDILSNTNLFAVQSPFLTLGLVGAVAILLTLRLVLRWFERPEDHAEVVLVPLALLVLTALAVSHDAIVPATVPNLGFTYGKGVSWEGWVSVFLCLLLVACGWIARQRPYGAARTDGSASMTSLATSP